MRDADGKVLNVRKRGTSTLMLPGGKPEPGESAAETAVREIAEELGIALDELRLSFLGEFRSAAANEAGFDVVASVFEHPYVAGASPAAEIVQLAWVNPRVEYTPMPPAADSASADSIDADPVDADPIGMAPLNTEHVFPALLARN